MLRPEPTAEHDERGDERAGRPEDKAPSGSQYQAKSQDGIGGSDAAVIHTGGYLESRQQSEKGSCERRRVRHRSKAKVG